LVTNNLTLMAAALLADAVIGDPGWLYARIPHPVTWMGNLLAFLDRKLNRDGMTPTELVTMGGISLLGMMLIFGLGAWALSAYLFHSPWGFALLVLMSSTLLAQRSLYDHVRAVAAPLMAGQVAEAQTALGKIVGREVGGLNETSIAAAAIESLAENLSDGVIAPLFWGCLLGFPGIVLYKVVNTADSMIGHRTERYLCFGRIAARLDDVLNFVPARLTGFLIAVVGFSGQALTIMASDARKHRSPNAGWPEAAMAGALDIRLSGPRAYHGEISDEPWIHPLGTAPDAACLCRALGITLRVYGLTFALIAIAAVISMSAAGPPR
jgi:adenosylcobinamide-phosphate synthase